MIMVYSVPVKMVATMVALNGPDDVSAAAMAYRQPEYFVPDAMEFLDAPLFLVAIGQATNGDVSFPGAVAVHSALVQSLMLHLGQLLKNFVHDCLLRLVVIIPKKIPQMDDESVRMITLAVVVQDLGVVCAMKYD